MGWTGAINVQFCAMKSHQKIFTTNTSDPPQCTVNWRFHAFRTIWVHSGPFDCLTKPDAKQAELVQKFMPRSLVWIFRNERTRSNPLDPKLMFWGISYYLCAFGAFGCLTKLGAKWTELVQKFVPRSRVGIFHNERTQSTPLDPKLTFWLRFVLFGCIRDRLVALRNSVQNGPK